MVMSEENTTIKRKDGYTEFLLEDFTQQYEEYRQAETSRIRYIEFFVSLVVAVVAFFAGLYQIVGFPAPNIYPMYMLFFICFVLFFIGYWIMDACISTRISQMDTAMYINDIARHFFSLSANDELSTSRNTVYFAKKEWDSEKTHFFKLMKILAFLLGVISSLVLFSVIRIVCGSFDLSSLIKNPNMTQLLKFWDYSTWINIASVIFGSFALIVTYWRIIFRLHKRLREAQKIKLSTR